MSLALKPNYSTQTRSFRGYGADAPPADKQPSGFGLGHIAAFGFMAWLFYTSTFDKRHA